MASRLAEIVDRLKNPKQRQDAMLDLFDFMLRKRDLPEFYRALSQRYPDDRSREGGVRRELFELLWDVHDGTTVKFVEDTYPSLSAKAIREAALHVLARMNTRPALQVLTRILVRDRSKPRVKDPTLFWGVLMYPVNAGVMFPDLLGLLASSVYRSSVYEVAAAALEVDKLKARALAPSRTRIIGDFGEAQRLYAKAKPESSSYTEAVDYVAAVLTVMTAFADDPPVTEILQAAVRHPNSRLGWAAYRACKRAGLDVASGATERLSADPSTRLDFYEYLRDAGEQAIFPGKWLNQEAFAEADMVRWLMHPNEYGRPPQKIELIETQTVSTGGKRGRLYVYKFTFPNNPREWKVGVSGPQPFDRHRWVTAGSDTFSDDRTVREWRRAASR